MIDEMASGTKTEDESKNTKARVLGFLVPLIFVLASFLLDHLDNTTELLPNHDGAMQVCFAIAGVAALSGIVFALRVWRSQSAWRITTAAIGCALASFCFAVVLLLPCTDLWFAWRDFPAAKTRTFPALLQISRAYATHGKSAGYDIQTMPVWSDMNISEQDYRFMQSHRRPDDPGRNPDEIRSKGYFCARVIMQQAGEAFRVLHAGRGKLPEGTVILCPTAASLP